MINECFTCEACHQEVDKHPTGSARNHCPFCLHSKHVDADFPGDRASECGGDMEPVRFENRKNKGLVIIHRCVKCQKEIPNKLAEDDRYIPLMRKFADQDAAKLPK